MTPGASQDSILWHRWSKAGRERRTDAADKAGCPRPSQSQMTDNFYNIVSCKRPERNEDQIYKQTLLQEQHCIEEKDWGNSVQVLDDGIGNRLKRFSY